MENAISNSDPNAPEIRTEPHWLPPIVRSLATKRIEAELPPEATCEAVEHGLDAVNRSLEPASLEAFFVLLDRLVEWGALFGLPATDRQALARFYHASLHDLPPDLLATAIERIQAEWKFSGRWPLPADLRGKVSEDLSERRRAKIQLEKAQLFGRLYGWPDEDPRDAERRRALPGKGQRASPGFRDQADTTTEAGPRSLSQLTPAWPAE